MNITAITKSLKRISPLPSYSRLESLVNTLFNEYTKLEIKQKECISKKPPNTTIAYPSNLTFTPHIDAEYYYGGSYFPIVEYQNNDIICDDNIELGHAITSMAAQKAMLDGVFAKNKEIFDYLTNWANENNKLLTDIRLGETEATILPNEEEKQLFADQRELELIDIDDEIAQFQLRLQPVIDEIKKEYDDAVSSGSISAAYILYNQIQGYDHAQFLANFPNPTPEQLEIFVKTR